MVLLAALARRKDKDKPASLHNIIRIHHGCECGIEISILSISVSHHNACQVITNGNHEGWIFLSHPHTNNIFFFLFTAKTLILYWINMKKAFKNS